MNILLNLYQVQSGGGQQVASSFLKVIAEKTYGHNWFVYVGTGSELSIIANDYLKDHQILCRKYSYTKRFFGRKRLQEFVKNNDIDLVYNFGPILPNLKIPQVVRSVYSNLYFPEIPFWSSYSWSDRLKKKIIDHLRLKGTLAADGLIFENESMLARAVELFDYDENSVFYVEPSISLFSKNSKNSNFEFLNDLNSFKILYLSSWYLNKNISILPHVSAELKKKNIQVKFILSLDKNDPAIQDSLIDNINNLHVTEYFEFIGKVEAIYVHQVIKSCDAMILLSKLECFSSNVIEAFTFKKPLIVSDEPWAKAACSDAGLFVNRDDPKDIAQKIEELYKNSTLYKKLTTAGDNRLKDFNTPIEKVSKQIDFLEKIYQK